MATLKSLKNKYLSASDGAVLGVTTNTENISALSFKLATADSLSKFNLVDGFSDDYNDATGVDASASTDATRNAANYYAGSGTSAGSTGFTVASPAAGQTFTVPTGVSSVDIKVFANGSNNNGGFSTGTLATSAGTQYLVVVGDKNAGTPGNWNSYSYGGGGRTYNGYSTGSGLTGVFTGSTDITDWTSTTEQARAIIIAGGGGGRGHQGSSSAGSGGGTSGTAGTNTPGADGGLGGTQSAPGGVAAGGGSPANVMRGGQSNGSPEEAGGGGGWYGGGGGGSTYGSGGGSGYVGAQNNLTSGATYVGASSQKTSDPDYPGADVAKVLFKYDIALYEDMTLVSNAFTAQADPATARIILDEETAVGTTTLDTDIKAYASRDNGTTFTQIALADQGYLLPNPGNDGYTKLMMHMDGAASGTTFTDSSASAHTITRNSGTTQTAIKKFGTASCYQDGTGTRTEGQLEIANSSDWDFGTGAFTIDFWLYLFTTGSNKNQKIIGCSNYSGGWNGWHLAKDYNNMNIKWEGGNNTTAFNTSGSTAIVAETWTHVALAKSGTTTKLFFDGVEKFSIAQNYAIQSTGSELLQIGEGGADANWELPKMYIDEIRISKGIARWTSAFTPPVMAYSTSRRLLSGSVDISGQPAGSNMKYKITTHNQATTKQTRVYGTSMAWA